MNEEVLATGGLRNDGKGRHTTTYRQLVILPNGGVVIDTPGMRELQISSADFNKTFSDIENLALKCKFSDCNHESEPRCAVRAAIENGDIDEQRLENYRKLQKELKYQELKSSKLGKKKIY